MRLQTLREWAMKKKSPKYSPEVMERAVYLVFEGKEQYESQ
jgi:hypothetical protein